MFEKIMKYKKSIIFLLAAIVAIVMAAISWNLEAIMKIFDDTKNETHQEIIYNQV